MVYQPSLRLAAVGAGTAAMIDLILSTKTRGGRRVQKR